MMRSSTLSLTLGLAIATHLHGQVSPDPQIIRGGITFNNVNPAILSILNAPGNEGFSSFSVYATKTTPPALSSSVGALPASSRTSGNYEITVQSDPSGFVYEVLVRAHLSSDNNDYFFRRQIALPVTPSGGPVTLNFAECAGIIRLRFLNPSGSPVPVDGGTIKAITGAAGTQAESFRIGPGSISKILVVRSGEPLTLETTVYRGTDTYTDKTHFKHTTSITVPCDTIENVDVELPPLGSLGRIVGTVDLRGEFEMTVDALDALDLPDYTGVIADQGPFNNKRYDHVPGVNFTVPASGPFALQNLLSTAADPASSGYQVYAHMLFYTHARNQFSYFQTPILGALPFNPRVSVAAGATVDLGDTFVIEPGYIAGRILLEGPPETPSDSSMLRGMTFATDADGDGIPDAASVYGLYHSRIYAIGVNRLASGATRSAAGGSSSVSFAGSFDPASESFDGNYELAVGGLNSQRSIWEQTTLNLVMSSNAPATGIYYFNTFNINDTSHPEFDVLPGSIHTRDVSYCFGEVFVQFRSRTGRFYNPKVRVQYGGGSHGGRSYEVNGHTASGYPPDIGDPSNIGYVRLLLPAGTYRLVALVTPEGAYINSETEIEQFDLTIGCRERIRIEHCLQLNLDTPTCVTNPIVHVSGNVRSCSNKVTRIFYTLNGGPQVDVCNSCGPDPSFNFNILIPDKSCEESTLTVTAIDADNHSSWVTTLIRYDTEAPRIFCPSNISVECAGPAGTPVSFSPTATDNCPGDVAIICAPPSGSLFPVGATEVTCYAVDRCGYQSSKCTFKIFVKDDKPPEIRCPTNIVVTCASSNGTRVQFTVEATDNCTDPVPVMCTPPAGSVFPIGTTVVTCTASDMAGNTADCSFTVTLRGPRLQVERAIIVTWDCGILQGADNVTGPWTDIPGATSPYCVPSSGAHRFYRVRN